jgi:DNA-directed RNA polymerase subunit RPC12/RpoP
MQEPPPHMRIIGTSFEAVRLMCEACGAHMVVNKRRLTATVRCSTCDERRMILERRTRDLGRTPERRMTLPSV